MKARYAGYGFALLEVQLPEKDRLLRFTRNDTLRAKSLHHHFTFPAILSFFSLKRLPLPFSEL
jgi:hypothetical protein